jgi:peptidylprolyl isomerase
MLKQGQRVVVEYACAPADGTVCAISSEQGKRMEFIFGSAQMPPGFVQVIDGMKIGETRTVNVLAEEAYGVYDASRVEAVPFNNIPNPDQLPIGEYIFVSTVFGTAQVKVAKVEGDQVYLDFNHKLAGQDLSCTIKLIDLPGQTGSNIKREKYLTGGCACGCDEVKHVLQSDRGHLHAHTTMR